MSPLLLTVLLLSPSPVLAEDLLFLGNSYTQFNNLDAIAAPVFDEGLGRSHSASKLVSGGLTFTDHLTRVQEAGTDWSDMLGDNSVAHDWVILQEQSQIPGFPEHTSYVQDSLDAAGGLDLAATTHGAETLFFMTWGRREGDSTNAAMFPDFETMQALLTEGYLRYVATTSTDDRPTWVAPVGLAFALAHSDTAADKGDALAPDGLFWQLYNADGSHPSLAGSYLTACVIYASITGNSPVGLSARPDGLSEDLAATLQDIAARTVFEETDAIDYPWETTGTGDSGTGDGGTADGGTGDGGTTDGGTTDGGSGDGGTTDSGTTDGGTGDGGSALPTDDDDGCGCSQASPGSALGLLGLLAMVGMLARRRRQQDGSQPTP